MSAGNPQMGRLPHPTITNQTPQQWNYQTQPQRFNRPMGKDFSEYQMQQQQQQQQQPDNKPPMMNNQMQQMQMRPIQNQQILVTGGPQQQMQGPKANLPGNQIPQLV